MLNLMEIQFEDKKSKPVSQVKINKKEDARVPISSIFLAEHPEMKTLQACRVCLLTKCRLYSMEQLDLTEIFKQLTGLRLDSDGGLPLSLCVECALFVRRCQQFRAKSRKAQALLNLLTKKSYPVTIKQIKQINRKANELSSHLSVKQTPPDHYDIFIKEDDEGITFPNDAQTKIGSAAFDTSEKDEKMINDVKTDDKNEDYKMKTEIKSANKHYLIVRKLPKIKKENLTKTPPKSSSGGVVKNIDLQRKTKAYICNQCRKVLVSKRHYLKHLRQKHHSSQHVCGHCGMSFMDNRKLQLHQQRHHSLDNYIISKDGPSCLKCSLHFISEEALQTHLNGPSKIQEALYNSDSDDIKSERSDVVNDDEAGRQAQEGKNEPQQKKTLAYICSQCRKVLINKKDYLTHLRQKHHASQHVCCHCGMSFMDDTLVKLHQEQHHSVDNLMVPENSPSCPECSLQFISEVALQTHLNGPSDLQDSLDNSDIEDLNTVFSDNEENEATTEYESDDKPNEIKIEAIAKKKGRPKKAVTLIKKKRKEIRKRTIEEERVLLKDSFCITKLSFEEQLEALKKRKDSRLYNTSEYTCELCFMATNLKKTFEIHMTKHDKSFGRYACDVCHLRFKHNFMRMNHKKKHQVLYSCLKCTYTTVIYENAKNHVGYHEGTTFSCQHCSETFRVKNSYKTHLRVKHPSSKHVCCLCGFSFVNEKGQSLHMRLKHALDKTEIPADGPSCEECSLTFLNDDALQTHLRVSPKHNADKRIRNDSSVHQAHLYYVSSRDHPRKNNYYACCELCGKFMPKTYLESHLEEHAGIPFQCPLCNRMLKSKRAWFGHKYTHHSGKWPRDCEHCGKPYSSLSNLTKHVRRIHSEKLDKCHICNKGFKDLKQHVNHVHLNKAWPRRTRRSTIVPGH